MTRPYHIRDAAAIRLLSSPLRQGMLDWIESSGAATVAQLAQRLGRPADRLYYHVKLMVRAGLLVEKAGDVESSYDVPGRPMRLDYGDNPRQRRAVSRVVSALMRTAQRDFGRAAADTSLRVDGPRRELWSGRIEGMLSPAEVAAVNAHISAAIDTIRAAGRHRARGRRPYQLTWSISPS